MNIEAVARKAGVSATTVSRVLNDVDVVRRSTRARVIAAIHQLRYHPNLHARNLAGRDDRTIGLIVSNLDNPYFVDIYASVEDNCRRGGYELVIANTSYRPERLAAGICLMIGRRVGGLALMVTEMDDKLFRELSTSEFPIVWSNAGDPVGQNTILRIDYSTGIRRVVDYLKALGHKDFACVGHNGVAEQIGGRMASFYDSFRNLGLKAGIRAACDEDSFDGGRRAASALLSMGSPPTAIICANDLLAVGALRELRERGFKVPQDISIVGFDNVKLSEFCHPALTTVHIPRDQIGRAIFESLASPVGSARVEGREISICPELVVRDSVGPPRHK